MRDTRLSETGAVSPMLDVERTGYPEVPTNELLGSEVGVDGADVVQGRLVSSP